LEISPAQCAPSSEVTRPPGASRGWGRDVAHFAAKPDVHRTKPQRMGTRGPSVAVGLRPVEELCDREACLRVAGCARGSLRSARGRDVVSRMSANCGGV
jgi:hypothetical protein